jgi:hypothetical protein
LQQSLQELARREAPPTENAAGADSSWCSSVHQ